MQISLLPTIKYRTSIFLALITAGLAGNYFSFPIFLNIDFLFGSIFALLILQFFGLSRGIFSAAVIACCTFFLWNHPYAIVIMTAEVGVVGWQMEYNKRGLVLADMLFWLIIGIPLVFIFYHLTMHVSLSNTSIVMAKQAVNGIANAMIARLIFIGFNLRTRASLISSSEIMGNLLSFFVLCPTLLILAISSRSDFAETDTRIRTLLIQDSQLMNEYLKIWVINQESVVTSLAEMAAARSPQQMQSYLELTKRSNVNFLRIGQLDREATITAYFPLLDELGQENIGKNFADRPFIPILKQRLKPILSEVVMGRIGTPKPMVTMLAPIVIKEEYAGYITGIMSLDQIRDHLDKRMYDNAMLYTLVDKNGNIIMTNHTDQKVMTPFVRGKGTINHFDKGIDQWAPIMPSNVSIMERWKNSFYIAETVIGHLAEWKLIMEQPVAPFQKALNDKYTSKITFLLLILLGALALAEVLSRRSIDTLVKLGLVTHDLPIRLAAGGKVTAWPASGIEEIYHLIDNFKKMEKSLLERFNDIQQINESLELRVAERTEELSESEEKYRVFFHNELYAVCIFDPETLRFLDTNDAHVKLYGYSKEELIGRTTVLDLSAQHHESDGSIKQMMANRTTSYIPLRYHKKKDGTVFPVEIVGGPYSLHGKNVIFAIVRDITQRIQAEEALKYSLSLLRASFESTADGILIVDKEGKIVRWNQKFIKMWKIPNEIISTCSDEKTINYILTQLVDPVQFANKVRELYEKPEQSSFDQIEFADGRIFERYSQPQTIDNTVVGRVWCFRDITAQRNAENKLIQTLYEQRIILDNANVGITMVIDRIQRWVNRKAVDMFKYSREEMEGMPTRNFYPSQEAYEQFGREACPVLTQGQVYESEQQLLRRDGTPIWVRLNGKAIHPSELSLGTIWLLDDITERKFAEETLRANLQEKEVLLREIHHRIKNNMQMISSLLSLQSEGEEDEQVRQALAESQQRIFAMAMIHETLYKAKNLALVDISDYLKRLISHLQGVYNSQAVVGIILELEKIELSIDLAVPCGLIINELLTNAFKHAFPGGGSKEVIQIKNYLLNDREMVLEISDNGVGFPADFDLENTTSLGLKLVKGLLKHQLRGNLNVIVGKGTTFILRWPLPDLKGEST